MDFDDLKDGLAFAGKIVGEIAGAIGSAMVEAFRLAMRIHQTNSELKRELCRLRGGHLAGTTADDLSARARIKKHLATTTAAVPAVQTVYAVC